MEKNANGTTFVTKKKTKWKELSSKLEQKTLILKLFETAFVTTKN